MNEYPFVTAIIVVRNEEKYIERCFKSLLNQSYPSNRYEILIIDGLSDDNTLEIVKQTEIKYNNSITKEKKVEVVYIKNSKKILASGWNLGIKSARGKYVVRIDAHGYADKDFIKNSVDTILKIGDAVCVGGTMDTKAITHKGKLVAYVLSSPFGVGNSKFRYSKKKQYVDTVAFGLYKKEIFNNVGYFDEKLVRNQDNDMHRRIREIGGKFYLNPEIKSTYNSRESILSMMRQGFNNGKWNIITFRKDPKSLSLRHLVPLFFLISMCACLSLGLVNSFFWKIGGLIIVVYILLGLIFGAKATKSFKETLAMPIIFLLLHLSYGYGSLITILKLK